MTKESHLHQLHQKSGAKFTSFASWFLPVHFAGQIHEHRLLRENAGIFDLSHLFMVDLLGAGRRSLLRLLLTKDVDHLKINHGFKALMLNHHGGIINDVYVFHQSPEQFHLICNQFNYEEVMNWLSRQCKGLSVGIQEQTDLSLVSIDGPKSLRAIKHLIPDDMKNILTQEAFTMLNTDNCFAARIDLVGETGLMLGFPKEQVDTLWKKWVGNDLQPCGLGAWLAAMVESGICTYGIDISTTETPYECGLADLIDWEPGLREFIGKGALETQKQSKLRKKLAGIILQEDGMLQHGQTIRVEGQREGIVTSGTFSPLFNHAIGLGYVPDAAIEDCEIYVRDKWLKGQIVSLPFKKDDID